MRPCLEEEEEKRRGGEGEEEKEELFYFLVSLGVLQGTRQYFQHSRKSEKMTFWGSVPCQKDKERINPLVSSFFFLFYLPCLIKPSAQPCKGMEEILGKSEPVKAEVGNLCRLFFFTRGQRVAGELPGQ